MTTSLNSAIASIPNLSTLLTPTDPLGLSSLSTTTSSSSSNTTINGQASSSTFVWPTPITMDPNVLAAYLSAKAGVTGSSTGSPSTPNGLPLGVPTAPWNLAKQPPAATVLKTALNTSNFVNPKAVTLDSQSASADYKGLFAMYQALQNLQALANAAADKKTPSTELPQIQQQFDKGMSQLSSYVNSTNFKNFRLTQGGVTTQVTSTAKIAAPSDTYTTAPIITGSMNDVVQAFQGDVQFNLNVTDPGGAQKVVNFNLADMGTTPRTMSTVEGYMNNQLAAAGVVARVSLVNTQIPAQTMSIGGQTVTIAPATQEYSFQISGLTAETLQFSPVTSQAAVYVTQNAGAPAPASSTSGTSSTSSSTTTQGPQQQVIKLEAGDAADASVKPGESNPVATQVMGESLPAGVSAIHATAVGSDGSVYMLGDATSTVAGQPIKGAQDAVLLKYDSAGNLVYSRTLGAGVDASGLSLAVSSSGQVAIAGTVTGLLNGSSGASASTADSFVSVFDTQGQQVWTQRSTASGSDQAQAVAFDANGNVYVAGKVQGSIGGGTPTGGWDGYLTAYDSSGNPLSTQQFGSVQDDSVAGIAVNGTNVYVASQDGTHAVVRSFDATNPAQLTQTGQRDLGSIGQGSVAGIGLDGNGNLVIGGDTASPLSIGTVTSAATGNQDAFAAQISTDLSSTANDAVAYYGGTGNETVKGMTVVNGEAWLTGSTTGDLPNAPALGTQDGFVAALNVGTGQVAFSQRFTGTGGVDAPESIAVDPTGGSALDRLGLPQGVMNAPQSQLVTAATSARAGDSFQIKIGTHSAQTITISATDTLATLAQKMSIATGTEADVTVVGGALTIKPANTRQTIQLISGPSGKDALVSLGLPAGEIRDTTTTTSTGAKSSKPLPADHGPQIYGLRLNANLDLSSAANISAAQTQLGNAINTLQSIYIDLKNAASPQVQAAAGTVPAYLSAQLANYQAGLTRLTAGTSGTGLLA